jgi:glycosyltransferase involved in cell wall biosynthesis
MIKLSFVVIAYNEQKTITNCVESILQQSGMDNLDYEIIVVNDASTDNTLNVVNSLVTVNNPRIRVVNFTVNRGRGFARHEGVKESRGAYVAFVDADITLPKSWTTQVLACLKNFDGAGGIAIPDGDSTYIAQRFCLEPKRLPHTFEITGSNSIYKKEVFEKVLLNPDLRDGEDADIVQKMLKFGYKIKLVESLVVNHREDIDFKKSIKRMYSFGKGATRLLVTHKKIRAPDISFFVLIILFVTAPYAVITKNYYFLLFLVIYPLLVSYAHIFKKFKHENSLRFFYSGFANYFMISSYFTGRFVGLISKE